MQPFPWQDDYRENRVIAEVADIMHQTFTLSDDDKTLTINAAFKATVQRWVKYTVRDVARRRRWWWQENLATGTLDTGQDLVDLKGDVEKVAAVYCPRRLHRTSLEHITELRQVAAADNRGNAARECTHYALEAGRRIHLWPAPAVDSLPFALLYTRPAAIALIPDRFEPAIVDGVIGMRARHWDKDSLIDKPASFEGRYERALRELATDSWDVERIDLWEDAKAAGVSQATASSATDTATEHTVPASLTGIGHECIYVLDV